MASTPNTLTQRVYPRHADAGRTFPVNGRTYTAADGVSSDVSPQDEADLCANGWYRAGGRDCIGVGTTAQRPPAPTGLYHGCLWCDTTLGALVQFDGLVWRNPVTGAVV